jgi:peptidoglycan/xylan/chitin deacetylase (PgdA/CDA1 family)
MKVAGSDKRPLTPVAVLSGVAFVSAFLLFVWRPAWAVLPLMVFVGACLSAPFFPAWGFFLPVYSRGRTGRPVTALTFDDGPDPETTPRLLDLLDRYGIRATFFVTGERVKCYGDLVAAILARGHAIGNHSFSHDVFLMCRTSGRLAREIVETQSILLLLGIAPLVFRPPVGITSPRLGPVLNKLDLSCVNFSCRGGDFGNRRIRGMAGRVLRKIKADDILMLHDIQPHGGATVAEWIGEVEQVICGLREKGLQVIPLVELLGQPIMAKMDQDDQ